MATTTAPAKTAQQAHVTATMSEWAAGLQFEQLSAEAVYQAKRFLLDSMGCALGGYQQHDVTIALEVLDEIAGPGKATLIGSGKRWTRSRPRWPTL
jgi:2-methylcitrate dehydratase